MFLSTQSADLAPMGANTIRNRPSNDRTVLLSKEISKILDETFQNENTPIKTNTFSGLGVPELEYIYKSLIGEIIAYNDENAKKRPKCPVISLYHQSLANMEYKKEMIEYISNFNITLSCFTGSYKASILEALANYCEYKVKSPHKNS